MLRKARMKYSREAVDGFRMRGQDVTGLESFSDAVFGFALTLLVVSLEVPRSFADLIDAMRGFPAFAVCFAMLAMHPRAGRRRDDLQPGLRGFPVGAYIVLYRIDEGDVVIVRVLRGSRDLDGIFRE